MPQINQLELENLRHLIYSHETSAKKLEAYAQQATDPQVNKCSKIRTGCKKHKAAINVILKLKEVKQ